MIGVQTAFIVDDDESFRKAAQRMFRSARFGVPICGSAGAFLSGSKPCDEACVVLHLRIAAIGGLERMERMERMRQRRIDLSVIVCTAEADVALLLWEPRNEGFIRQIDARYRQEVLTRLADPRAA